MLFINVLWEVFSEFYDQSGLSQISQKEMTEQNFRVYDQYRAFVFMQIVELLLCFFLGPIYTTEQGGIVK